MSFEDTTKKDAAPEAAAETTPESVASPIANATDFMPPKDILDNFLVPSDIIVKLAGFLAMVPNNYQPEQRVQAFNEVMTLVQSRFQIKLHAEAFIANGMILAKPTCIFVEDILAAEKAQKAANQPVPQV